MFTELTSADGHTLDCWMMPSTSGQVRGGIVILQEIFGVTDQLKGVAERYANLGYSVAIPALFDRQGKQAVIPFDEAETGRAMMLDSDLAQTMLDVEAAVEGLKAGGGKVAVIGFCWGGGLAIRAAQVSTIACAVSFYGTRLPQYLGKPLKAPVLGHFGTTDDHVPPDMLAQMQQALPQMEVHLYEAGHAFANDARSSYVPEAADLAHRRTQAFLAKYLS